MKQKASRELTAELERQEWYETLGGQPVLRCALVRPVFSGTWRGLRAMRRYYARVERITRRYWRRRVYLLACLALAERQASGGRFRPWQAELDTVITHVGDGVISVVQEARERRAPEETAAIVRQAVTWELAAGAPRTLASFFPGRGWKKRVLAQVSERARERLASGESLLYADCEERLARHFDPERYYLTERGAAVFFPVGTIAAPGEGAPSFSIELPDPSQPIRKRHGKSAASSA